MSVGDFLPAPVSPPSFSYRFMRGLARLWVNLFFRKVRFVNPGALPAGRPAMLLIGHPASLLDAVLLITAFERHVHCFLDGRIVQGFWRSWFARFLDMISYEAADESFREAVERAGEALQKGEMLAFFADDRTPKPGEPHHLFTHPALIAMQAEVQHAGQLGLEVYPVHVFLPVAQLYSSELLIYLDTPLIPAEYLARGGSLADHAQALAASAEESCRQNVHRLQQQDIQLFLADLAEILRTDLKEDWEKRPNWKQKVDGFGLSQFIAEWVEQLNGLHPGQLVALRDRVETYRETKRSCALGRMETEQAGEWLKSAPLRIACWMASLIGLPIALYGVVNHLVAGIILRRAGFLENKEGQNQAVRWGVSALVVLGTYALQTLLCAHWLGRTITGYYAPSLPLSGAWLLGYVWLLRHQTSYLLLDFRTRRLAAKLLPMRKELIRELDSARDTYAEMLGLVH